MKKVLFFLLLPLLGLAQGRWIPLSENQVLQLNGHEIQRGLFDEGPRLFQGSEIPRKKAQKPFHPSYQKLYQPQDFLIDLKGEYFLDSLLFFDGAGRDSFLIYRGHPGDWQPIAALYTNSYQSWRQVPISGPSRFLLFRFLGPQAEIGEVYLYGQKIKELEPRVQQRKLSSPQSLNDFMGINAFVDDPQEKVESVAGAVREYHNWDWHYPSDFKMKDLEKEGLRFAPAAAGNWNFDHYYRGLKKAGLAIYPCLQGSPPWLKDQFDHKPRDLNYAADDPRAYRLHSTFVWNYAARYGNERQPLDKLNLASDQAALSGLNLIAGLETWNEPDKWWRGREGYFHPFEYAAMLSADYDGHAGSLGAQYGLKQADPKLDMLMAGLAGLDSNYIEAIRLWALYNRPEGDFPADVLNLHHYSNDAGGQDDRAQHAISPEEDGLKSKLEAMVRYRNRHLPGLKIFLSEFGYDSNPKSIQAPSGDDSLYVLEMQARYLIRSILLAQAAGIDKAFVYMLRDVNAPNPNKYMSSGLTAEKWHQHRPKPAFYKLKKLKAILGDYVFEEHEQPYLRKLYILRYRHPQNNKRAYVLWNSEIGSSSHFKKPYFLEESKAPKAVYRLESEAGGSKARRFNPEEGLKVDGSPLILIYD